MAYYRDASGNAAVDRKTDFYPFGLEFGGGGLSVSGSLSPNYLYSFQEQEKQQDTGWITFKWRNYDPTYVRFFNIDPLAEKYAYQSPFNFSENAVVAHRGLEKQHVFYTPFGVLVYTSTAGAGAASSQSTGVYNELKRATNNSLNFWGGVAAGAGAKAKDLANRVLNSESDSKAKNKSEDSKTINESSEDEGVIYKRKDKNGDEKDYVGQAKNEERYKKRKKEHQRNNPDADYDFEVVERGKAGKDLDKKEQQHIDEGGGPTNKSNPNGGLQNKRNQIKPKQEPKIKESKTP